MDIGVLHSVVGEVWVPVKGFPNYVVSNRGRVYSPHVRRRGVIVHVSDKVEFLHLA